MTIVGCGTARNTDFNLKQTATPSDGVITCYGVIDGNLVYVYSQDASVLGGTIGEMHAKKIARLYVMALKIGAPVIGLIDCAGLRLQEATDALAGFGQVYLNQTMASGVIPQISESTGVMFRLYFSTAFSPVPTAVAPMLTAFRSLNAIRMRLISRPTIVA